MIKAGEKPFLFLFDDFEWNLEPRGGGYILKPEAAEVLSALVWAIQEVGAREKIIITCRYEFQSELLSEFWVQGLDAFRKADLEKKLKRLDNFNSGKIDEKLIERGLKLADGNARLLEWLDKDVFGCEDIEGKLSQLESSSEDWQGKIIWSELYAQIDEKIVWVLSHCLVFEIPVPMLAFEAVCESIYGYQEQLNRGIDLGLIEVSSEVEESERVYRVSRILPRIISSVKLPEVPEVYSLYEKGSEKLFELWGMRDNKTEERWREIFRLKFANKENPERFREGFSQMLSLQKHLVSNVYEFELRKNKAELSANNLCSKLEEYLRQNDWRKADQETAFIFLAVMALENFNRNEIYQKIPCKILKEIDRLWVRYSDGKFGFSIQNKIYQSLYDGSRGYNSIELWLAFSDRVGWDKRLSIECKDPTRCNFDKPNIGHLPSHATWSISGVLWEVGVKHRWMTIQDAVLGILYRQETCDFI